jgi:hypothetical protein
MTRPCVLPHLSLLLLLTPACRLELDEMAASEAADSSDVAMNEGALLSSGVDDSMVGLSAEAVASRAEIRANDRFQPAGCATITRSQNVVTYVLVDCTGPRGMIHVTGTAVATFTDVPAGAQPAGVQIALAGTAMKINRASLDFQTTGLLTQETGLLKLVVTTLGNGIGPRGHSFVRTGGYTVIADGAADCLQLDGQWKLDAGLAERSTTVTGLRRCKDACPAAGGQIVHTGFRGRTVTLEFDGTSDASWSSTTGKSGTIDLSCGQNP